VTRIGVVTGMRAEADCLPRSVARFVRCAGPGGARAGKAAHSLVDDGAEALVSFGLAGGLDPALPVSTVILGLSVVGPEGARSTLDPDLRARLAECVGLFAPIEAPVAGTDAPVAGIAGKARLLGESGARVADMESHAVARIAAERGVPCGVVRVVADPAGRAVPRAALAALGEAGDIRTGRLLATLAARPWELPGLAALAIDTRRAFRTLRRCGAALSPLFGRG
jgi:adenosylhomocysteine nucleosidase